MNLIEAIQKNNQEEFFRLLNLPTDPSGKKVTDEVDANYGGSPLYWAAHYGYAHFVDPLVKAGVDVSKPDKYDRTPVYIAAYYGHPEVITALLEAGADASIRAACWRGTALEIARRGKKPGHQEVVRLLEAHLKQTLLQVKENNLKTMSLIEAIQKNNQEEFFRLLNLLTDPSGKKVTDGVDAEYGGSPLYWAAYYGDTHFINPLIKRGADVSKPDKYGRTPVYVAACNGHAEAIAALKVAGANVDTPNNDGETPVYAAACNRQAEAIRALKTVGANVDTPDNNSWTPVFVAAQRGYTEIITLLKAMGANVDTPNNDGTTPIYATAQKGYVAAMNALLASGADASIRTKRGTPLEIASATPDDGSEYLEIVRLLETHFKQYPRGVKPVSLIGAIKQNNQEEFFKFLNLKTDPLGKRFVDAVDTEYEGSPLCWAARCGYVHFINPLVKAGADVNKPDEHGWTPVSVAAYNGHAEAIVALKAAGADVNTPRPDGTTPVCIAAFYGYAAAITAFLEAGADANIKTQWGTALEQARQGRGPGHQEVVRLLEAHFKQYPNGIKPTEAVHQEAAQRFDIAGSAGLNALQEALAKERQDKDIMQQRLERLEKAYSATLAVSSVPQRRGSSAINLEDKKGEQEKLRHVLEALRTFFIEERSFGEKTDNYAIYNEYLEKVNHGAQLAYKVKQNEHVLYVNGKPLDGAEVTVDAISTMLESLPNVHHQPAFNLSTSFLNNPQNSLPAMPSSSEQALSSAQSTPEGAVDKPRSPLKTRSSSFG